MRPEDLRLFDDAEVRPILDRRKRAQQALKDERRKRAQQALEDERRRNTTLAALAVVGALFGFGIGGLLWAIFLIALTTIAGWATMEAVRRFG